MPLNLTHRGLKFSTVNYANIRCEHTKKKDTKKKEKRKHLQSALSINKIIDWSLDMCSISVALQSSRHTLLAQHTKSLRHTQIMAKYSKVSQKCRQEHNDVISERMNDRQTSL